MPCGFDEAAYDNWELDQARPAYRLVRVNDFIARNRPSAGALVYRARLLIDFCRYREAFADINRAQRLVAKPHPVLFGLRAQAYAGRGDWKQAARSYRGAINLHADEPPHVELAGVLLRDGRFDDARGLLRLAWRRSGEYRSEAALLLARSYAAQEQFDRALQWFRRLEGLAPDQELSHVLRARSLARGAAKPGAQRRIRELDKQDRLDPISALVAFRLWEPESIYSLAQLAHALTLAHRWREALTVQRRLQTLNPAWARSTLARMDYDSARYRAAAKLYGELATNADTVAWILGGSALGRLGLLQEAEQSYRQAVKCLDGDLDEGWLNLALVLRAQGRYAEGVECCQRALELTPCYDEAFDALEDLTSALSFQSG